MRGKRVHFSLPPVLRIKDYSMGYRVTIPYTPALCLRTLRRFRDITPGACRVLTNEHLPICLKTPLAHQDIHEGDAIHIVPLA